jgi:CRP-like cAMP-binding protein
MISRQAARNHILASLPSSIYAELEPFFEHIQLNTGQVLYPPNQSTGLIYFPLTAIVSCVHVLENGDSTEIAMIGREGMVGLYLLLGATSTINQTIVQTPGTAIGIRLSAMLNSFTPGNTLPRLLFQFTNALFAQMGQATICKQHHNTEQQLCRFLLSILDRQDQSTLKMTHELMSQLLGVRREAVSLAAAKLMKDGLIQYSRGHIDVIDRSGLEDRACECYEVVCMQYQKLLNWPDQPMTLAHAVA